MKKFTVLLTVVTVFLGAQLVHANSVTYRISAEIPAIIGVNVADHTIQENAAFQTTGTTLETQIQQIVRNDQPILLETVTSR